MDKLAELALKYGSPTAVLLLVGAAIVELALGIYWKDKDHIVHGVGAIGATLFFYTLAARQARIAAENIALDRRRDNVSTVPAVQTQIDTIEKKAARDGYDAGSVGV
ncbi:MAG: hypothetical protein M3167_06020 [Acidobacteriota bacterium]|nr:hypothetical protein [Acidobacteriota bacterium]